MEVAKKEIENSVRPVGTPAVLSHFSKIYGSQERPSGPVVRSVRSNPIVFFFHFHLNHTEITIKCNGRPIFFNVK